MPGNVFAEESLIISRWIVASELMENGDLQISEDLTFEFNDEFNGVYRDIIFSGTDDIENLQLFEVVNGTEVPYSLDLNAKKGDSKVYSYVENKDGINVMIYSPSEDESKTFRFKYTIKNVAIIHNDIGEFYYKYLGDGNETQIDYFSANLVLPQFNKENIKIFAHGPLNGTINFTNNELIKLEVNDVPTNTFIEARVFYPKEYTPLSTRTGNKTYNDLMDEELEYVRAIEEKAARREVNKSIFNNVSIVTLVIGAAVSYLFFYKNRRDPSIFDDMNSLYPEEISPAELGLFMNSVIDARGLMATLFDLARREYIAINELKTAAKKSSKDSDFEFIKLESPDSDLLVHERYLLSWLFNTIGNGTRLTTKEIDNYRNKQMLRYNKEYGEWSNLVKEQLKLRDYNDQGNKTLGIIFTLLSIPALIIGIISLIYGGLYGIGALIVSGLLFVLGLMLVYRKSDKGYIQYGLWKDFKKEFDNYENLNINIPKDKTLIYAVALGISMKKLDERRRYYGNEYYPLYWGYWYFHHSNRKGGSAFEDSLNTSFYGYTGTSSPNSTNFGGGGGFSGGGGGGAGGGGAGGF